MPDSLIPSSDEARAPIKVAIISHSDKLGQPSVVTHRLMRALRRIGVDARMVVFTRLTYDENVSAVSSRFLRVVRFQYERAKIFLSNRMHIDTLFDVSIANVGCRVASHPWVRDADIVVLSWINQGLLSLREVRRIGRLRKPMVWIMHDMWNFTGICHHSQGCKRYMQECGSCPFLRSNSGRDLSHKVWKRKRGLYEAMPINFVAVSSWLEDEAKKSGLLSEARIHMIPNAFQAEAFYVVPKSLRKALPVDYSRKLVLVGAWKLDAPAQRLQLAIDALNHLFENYPAVANSAMVLFFGEVADAAVFDRLYFPYCHIGTVNDDTLLREIYASSSVVLSTALYETSPGTLIEGQAAGCFAVTTRVGGMADNVRHLINGYVSEESTPEGVAEGIKWALDNVPDRKMLHDSVESAFDAPVVAAKYKELFERLLYR